MPSAADHAPERGSNANERCLGAPTASGPSTGLSSASRRVCETVSSASSARASIRC